MGDYRDRLRAKGFRPVEIEQTEKRAGDLVLRSWARPVERPIAAEVRRG